MRLLGIHAALGATVLLLATTAGPVAAQAPDSPTGTTTVRADCAGGGTLVVRQVPLESGATRVVVIGHDVPNGRWQGAFSPDSSTTERDVDLDVTARGREFRTAVEVEDVTGDTNTTLLRGSVNRACGVGQTVRAKSLSVSGLGAALVARNTKSGDLKVAGGVANCKNGSTWRFTVDVSAGNAGFGGGGGGVVCRKHFVRIPPLTADHIDGAVTSMSLVARSKGDVRRISYRVS